MQKYETYLRQVIEYAIEQGVVPIVATKADNLEGGNRINALIARLAWEYDIPLWNFWAAVQPLAVPRADQGRFSSHPGGMDSRIFISTSRRTKWSGWMARNLTALQALDAARTGLIAPVVT